ncbi:uncharacterized protein BYT42DRAFT_617936 [Radiomyces spectabilis]|uniref:uncharacterized protein n=1 Tax=Radiomyces spectabilis TaxID=64574 RepID=UPI00221F1667|nr:uncharacterized protein BYT42DRAFT_617936 [Radiomyces spectabilis]KAI8367510.1 hypothetical protein BYT42DRAFT_617936 [Radiomyces spectabilis]
MAILGFTPINLEHRINDKVLHFTSFLILGTCLYFLWNLSYKRNLTLASLILITMSIGSECIQSFLPYRTFDVNDIIANLLGGACGVACAFLADYLFTSRREHQRRWGGKREAEYQRALMDEIDLDEEDQDQRSRHGAYQA